MSVTAPKIDDRTWQQIVDRILALAPFYTPEWKAFLQDKESGNALVKLFAHMLEAVIARLNKTPDKNFIAFLDVLGIKALPARSARVPVTFTLAEGTNTNVLIPARTQVSAPATSTRGELLFITERNLLATFAKLMHVFSINSANDAIFNHTSPFSERKAFEVFAGDNMQEHILYLAHKNFFNIKSATTIELKIALPRSAMNVSTVAGSQQISLNMEWEYWDGNKWAGFTAKSKNPGVLRFQSSGVLALEKLCEGEIKEQEVYGIKNRWLRCRLLSTIAPHQGGKLPKLDTIMARIPADFQKNLLPDLVLMQDVPLNVNVAAISTKMRALEITTPMRFIADPISKELPKHDDKSAWLNDVSQLDLGDRLRFGFTESSETRDLIEIIPEINLAIILADSASEIDDAYINMNLALTSGSGDTEITEIRKIVAYQSKAKKTFIDQKWNFEPKTYKVIHTDKAVDSTNAGITLANSASNDDNAYPGKHVDIIASKGVGQSRKIISYLGASKHATVESNWKILPSEDSVYRIVDVVHDGKIQNAANPYIELGQVNSQISYKNKFVDTIKESSYLSEMRRIMGLDGLRAVVDANWEVVPANALYRIVEALHDGQAQKSLDPTKETITLSQTAPRNIDYSDKLKQIDIVHGTGAGQVRTIESYDPSTNKATIAPQWDEDAIPDETSFYRIIAPVHHGIARDVRESTIMLAADAPEQLIGKQIEITYSTKGNGQIRTIRAYIDGTVTVDFPWDPNNNPDTSCRYRIMEPVDTGTSQGAENANITLDSAATGNYTDMLIDIIKNDSNENQVRKIHFYDPTTQIATIYPSWETLPNNDNSYRIIQPIHHGRVSKANAESATLADPPPDGVTIDEGMQIEIIVGKGAGQVQKILHYNGESRIVDVDFLNPVPDKTSFFRIIKPVDTGTARAATNATITLPDSASKDTKVYDDKQIKIVAGLGTGQTRTIKYYRAQRLATVESNWGVLPDQNSYFEVIMNDGTVGKADPANAAGKVFWENGLQRDYSNQSPVALLTAIRSPAVDPTKERVVRVQSAESFPEPTKDSPIEVSLVQKSDKDPSLVQLKETAVLVKVERDRNELTLDRKGADFTNPYYEDDTIEIERRLDIYPLGQEPRLFSAFYIASQEVFSKKGARITIELNMAIPEKKTGEVFEQESPSVTWEYWDGKGWQLLALERDDTMSFNKHILSGSTTDSVIRDVKIIFRCPHDIAVTTVAGQEQYWIRARLVRGDYGQRVVIVGDQPKTGVVKPPVIGFNALTYELPFKELEHCLTFNNLDYEGHDDALRFQGQYFAPFKTLEHDQESLYLGFDQPLTSGPINLFFSLFEQAVPEVTKPKFAWTYWNGSRWAALIAVDYTEGLTRSDLLQITGPRDFAKRFLFGQERYWLRGSLIEGQFESTLRLKGIFPNTAWTAQASRIENEILGSSNATRNQEFTFLRTPVVSQEIWVKEPNAPSEEKREVILNEEGDGAIIEKKNAQGDTTEISIRWHEVEDFFNSKPTSRHYVIVDRVRGVIRFGDGEHGMIPPAGTNNIIADYLFGGGRAGNIEAAEISSLKSAVPFVKAAANYAPAGGGADMESLDETFRRGPQSLKNRNRAVTAEDYEWLTREASQFVARVKCLPNRNNEGQFEAGWVTVIIVPDSKDERPQPNPQMLTGVANYLGQRCVNSVFAPRHLHVTNPQYVEVGANVEIVPLSIDVIAAAEEKALKALKTFFHPLTGGAEGRGWEFGRKICISEVFALLESIREIDYVKHLVLVVDGITTGDDVEIDPYALVVSGEHKIRSVLASDFQSLAEHPCAAMTPCEEV